MTPDPIEILLVEDNEDDIVLIERLSLLQGHERDQQRAGW